MEESVNLIIKRRNNVKKGYNINDNKETRGSMSHHTHYFWAVKLPDDIKRSIHDEISHVQRIFQFQRFVHREDYHITLAFLGAADEQRLQEAIDLVGKAMTEEKSFPLQIIGLNVFGNSKAPRIFWGAVNEEERLYELQAIVHQQCLQAGFTLESRPYHPHITIARKWSAHEEFDAQILTKHNPFQEKPLCFTVNEIVLYKTNLDKTPKYEPIVRFSLE